MKINAYALACAFLLTGTAYAAEGEGSGVVRFVGSIVDAPCAVSPESSDQTVQMGSVTTASLATGKESAKRPFNISLEGCDVTTKKTVTATFTGVAVDGSTTLLALQGGTAKGAGIAIEDNSGKKIILGTKSSVYNLVAGNNKLTFDAYLKGTGTLPADTVTPGTFNTVANFTLAYQ